MKLHLPLFIVCILVLNSFVLTQEFSPDSNTLLLLHFNNSVNGAQGESPVTASGIYYEQGVFGQGAYLPTGNNLVFQSINNINSTSGTLEFWIKPRWDGDDGQSHVVLAFGTWGGILIFKDLTSWRSIYNRWSNGGQPEVGTLEDIGQWNANEWHHCAFTWNQDSLRLYINGQIKDIVPVTITLPQVNSTTFTIGADVFQSAYLDGVIDELRISNIERSPREIQASFLAGINITGLTITPDSLKLYPTWTWNPTLVATTNLGTVNIPASAAQWSSSNPLVVAVDSTGQLEAFSSGTAQLTATINATQAQLGVYVAAPVLPPQYGPIDPYLATPMSGCLDTIRVVILRYLPTSDGINLDVSYDPDFWDLGQITLNNLKSNVNAYDKRVKFMLEEGSRFRGYKDKSARPSVGYQVVAYITVYEPIPPGLAPGSENGLPVFHADFPEMFERFNIDHYVNDLGVTEIWYWMGGVGPGYPSYNSTLHRPENLRGGWESNMSSALTGDVSNSNRDNSDLPVYNKTYTVYGYNFRRTQAEAVHNHGHQLEAILMNANQRQDGNMDLFWKKFVGQDQYGNWITGRCGWTEMPPNTTVNYDYQNLTFRSSDIEDWFPDGGGQTKEVNCNTWGNIVYNWPGGQSLPQKTESQWYIYWMQNMPGSGSSIRYGSNYMTNWWRYTANWDSAIINGVGLYGPGGRLSPDTSSLSFSNCMVGSSMEDSVLVRNVDTLPIAVDSITSSNRSYAASPMSFQLLPSESVWVHITFSPRSLGTISSTISYHSGRDAWQLLTTSGSGINNATVQPTMIIFPNVLVPSTSEDTIVVKNIGITQMSIDSVKVIDNWFVVSQTNGLIPPADSLRFSVTFVPRSYGVRLGQVWFYHAGIIDKVSVSGTGLAAELSGLPAMLSLNPCSLGDTISRSITISNPGNIALQITSITSDNIPEFAIFPSHDITIQPAGSQTFSILFSPTASGLRTANIFFRHSAPDSLDTLRVSATGLAPQFTLAPSVVDFGSVPIMTTAVESVYVSNTGSDLLVLQSVVSDHPTEFIPTLYGLPTLQPGNNRLIRIVFAPKDIGERVGHIIITHNATSSPDTIDLVGSTPTTTQFTVELRPRWNLVSIPFQFADMSSMTLFPSAQSSAQEYTGLYHAVDTLKTGVGYWLKFPALEVCSFGGTIHLSDTIPIRTGWNLIGSISYPVAVSTITSEPPGIVTSNAFGYSTSYIITDTLYPGKGYWIKAGQEGSIILSANHLIASTNRIRIVPISELPPSAPMEDVATQELPKEFALQQNYPNPFNPVTVIKYQLPTECWVTLRAYNILGQEIITLVYGLQDAGFKSVRFDASSLPAGVYIYKLNAGEFTNIKKMILVK